MRTFPSFSPSPSPTGFVPYPSLRTLSLSKGMGERDAEKEGKRRVRGTGKMAEKG